MKNALSKAVTWAKENPLTADATGVSEALMLARKWRSERDRLVRAINNIRYECRDFEIKKIKGLAKQLGR